MIAQRQEGKPGRDHHADPASEWCLVAATLDAMLVARSTRGERTIAARQFFSGIMSTALAEDELLVEARLPLLANDARFGFNEFSRRAGDFAMSAAASAFAGKCIPRMCLFARPR